MLGSRINFKMHGISNVPNPKGKDSHLPRGGHIRSPRTNSRQGPAPKHVILGPELTFAGRAQRPPRTKHTLLCVPLSYKTALLKGVVL